MVFLSGLPVFGGFLAVFVSGFGLPFHGVFPVVSEFRRCQSLEVFEFRRFCGSGGVVVPEVLWFWRCCGSGGVEVPEVLMFRRC